MRAAWRRFDLRLGLLLAVLLTAAGCGWNDQQLRPPKPKEELTVPPEDDPRFSKPPEYPKDSLNKDTLIRPKDNSVFGPGNMASPKAGMSGMGMNR